MLRSFSLREQNCWIYWLAAGVLGLFLGIAAAISPRLAVALVASAVGLLIILKAKAHHVVWLIAFTIPFRFEYELASVRVNWTELLALLLAGLVLLRSFTERDFTWIKLPYKGLFSLFLMCGLIARVLGPEVEGIAQGVWHLYRTVIALPLLYFVVFASVRSERNLKITIGALITSFTLSSGVGIVQTLSGGKYLTGQGAYGNLRFLGIFPPYPSDAQEIARSYVGRISDVTHVPRTNIFRAHGGFTTHNYFAIGLVVVLATSTSLFLHTRSTKKKLLLGIAGIIQGLGLIFTFSRGGWIGFVISLVMIILSVRKRPGYLLVLKGMTLAALAIAFLVIVILMSPPPLVERAASILNPSEASEMQARFIAWSKSLRGIEEHPLWGHGTGGVEGVLMFGHSVTSHNIFLSVAYERGLIGLGALLYLVFSFVRDAFCLYYRNKKGVNRYLHGLGLGMFAGFTGFVVSGMLTSPILYPDGAVIFWFVAGLLVAVRRISRKEKNQTRYCKAPSEMLPVQSEF